MRELSRLCIGDIISLLKQSTASNPPVGTVGTIRRLYESGGGPAAEIDWECDKVRIGFFGDRVFLRDIELVESQVEIVESDASFDLLFGDVVV